MLSKWLCRPRVRDFLLGVALTCSALSLMVYPKESMAAVQEGLKLCYNVIVPALFPFFVLSTLVVELGFADYLGRLLEPVMRPLFGVGGVCASAVALGFVGGYPVGAKTALTLYQSGQCSKTEAERLLAFCNNSGPAFVLGVIGAGMFTSSKIGLLLYLCHAAASLCVGLLFRFYKRGECQPVTAKRATFRTARFSAVFTNAVRDGFLSTFYICAFVIFFTVVIRLLTLSGILPLLAQGLGMLLAPLGFTAQWGQRLLIGLIELSSGVWSLAGSGALAGKLSMAAFMLGWAGVSVHCQVLSFLGGSGLSVRTYLCGKLLHGLLSAGLVGVMLRLFPLDATISAFLAEQVEQLTTIDFATALTISATVAWLVWLGFFLLAVFAIRKNSGKRRKKMLQ